MSKKAANFACPDRLTILQTIAECLASAVDKPVFLDPDTMSRATGYITKAEALIELLEVNDCGSIGGFDKGMKRTNEEGPPSFFGRFVWLCSKYDHFAAVNAFLSNSKGTTLNDLVRAYNYEHNE